MTLSLLSFCLLTFSFSRQGQKFSICHVHVVSTPAKRWWEDSWFSSRLSSDMQSTVTLTNFNVAHDTTPFLIGTQKHASGLLGRVVNHKTTITLISMFVPALRWLSRRTSETTPWNSFSWVHGTQCQLFSSLLHTLSFVSQSESSKPEGPSRQPIRVQWRHSRLF